MTTAAELIETLGLTPHPEGGWHSDTWQPDWAGGRPGISAIYYLLDEGQSCHWHRIDCDETWYWHAGHPLRCSVAAGDHDRPVDSWLGIDVGRGQRPSHFIPRHAWQAAFAERGWVLVSCVVSPAFTFDGWELAPEGWAPGPQASALPRR